MKKETKALNDELQSGSTGGKSNDIDTNYNKNDASGKGKDKDKIKRPLPGTGSNGIEK